MKRLWGMRDSQETHLFVVDGEDPPSGVVGGTLLRHRPMSRTSDVISPFGMFVYDTNEAEFISAELMKLAAIVRKGTL
jgi:hypothetical protein